MNSFNNKIYHLKKITISFFLVKWSEKKAMLDDFLIACAVPKLTPSNFYPIIGLLKRILSDPNINVVQSGIKILGQLSKGLRKNFTSASKIFFTSEGLGTGKPTSMIVWS